MNTESIPGILHTTTILTTQEIAECNRAINQIEPKRSEVYSLTLTTGCQITVTAEFKLESYTIVASKEEE